MDFRQVIKVLKYIHFEINKTYKRNSIKIQLNFNLLRGLLKKFPKTGNGNGPFGYFFVL